MTRFVHEKSLCSYIRYTYVSICMDLYIFDILWHKWLLHC